MAVLLADACDDDALTEMIKRPTGSVSKQLAEPVSKKIGDEKQQASAGSKNTDEADALTASSSEKVAYSYIGAVPL